MEEQIKARIIIGADLAPVKEDAYFFSEGKIEKLIDQELLDMIEKADYRIFNLELPFIEQGKPIIKAGPNLKCSPSVIKGIKQLKVNLVTLANNHILDYGEEGLYSTIKLLNKNNISYVGVGDNRKQAKQGKIISVSGKKIGVYACAENEFSVAEVDSCGANPLELHKDIVEIQKLKKETDFLIVLFHGGIEYFEFIPPYIQEIAHRFSEAGADLILCQHSHCVGILERYKSTQILYGQGNFLFQNSENTLSKRGLLVQLLIFGERFEINYIPIYRSQEGTLEFDKISAGPKESSQYSEEELKEKYLSYVRNSIVHYMYVLAGWPLFFIWLDKLLKRKLIIRCFGRKRMAVLQNITRCEAHRAVIQDGVNLLLEKRKR